MTALSSDDLAKLRRDAEAELAAAKTAAELESWRVKYLGRKGVVPQLLRQVKALPEDQRRAVGAAANQLRQELTAQYEQRAREYAVSEVSVPLGQRAASLENPPPHMPGHLHPITLATRRLQHILAALGFLIVEGPEVEEEYYDFDALNIPLEHPARAESDSFYLEPRRPRGQGLVLRTSTSAVQVRSVLENKLVPPFRIASPGRVFRNEKPDATHESMFHQVEALMVGERVTVADYKYVTETLFSTFFGTAATIRLRPGYFPFVEPGFEVDMTCVFCTNGCRVCKYTGWIEMGGAGMVHPNVLRNMNIDAEKYQGFAFGYGIDRFTMLRHNINDIRLFWSGDIRFLRQFSQ